jgi:hypothetical protein
MSWRSTLQEFTRRHHLAIVVLMLAGLGAWVLFVESPEVRLHLVMGDSVRQVRPSRIEARVTHLGAEVLTTTLLYQRREVPQVEMLPPVRLERGEHLLEARVFRTGLPGESALTEHLRFTVGRDPDILINLNLGEGAE